MFNPEGMEAVNPNSIGELISVGRDIPTSPDKVYRQVNGAEAIEDLQESGVVRNKQSAGVVEKNRWGAAVYWSRGEEGRYHGVPEGSYVIEAPLSVASEREVASADVTAIYTKNERGEVVNIHTGE
jgi:hypothetical protein